MKTSYAASIALAIATLTAGHAMAADQSAPLTRAQVRAEAAQAQRTGDVAASDDLAYSFGATPGVKLNELFPGRYAAKAVVAAQAEVSGKTRAQVRAEAAQARRTGDVVASDDLAYSFGATPGVKLNELFPGRYATKSVVASKSAN